MFSLAERLSEDYHGGYWEFYTLSNGGFYMAPSGDRFYHVTCENQFEGDLSEDAFGITGLSICLQQPLVRRSGRVRRHLLRPLLLAA